jgi:hypothetical protein
MTLFLSPVRAVPPPGFIYEQGSFAGKCLDFYRWRKDGFTSHLREMTRCGGAGQPEERRRTEETKSGRPQRKYGGKQTHEVNVCVLLTLLQSYQVFVLQLTLPVKILVQFPLAL